LIFSTELARSTKECNTVPQRLRDEINRLNQELARATTGSKKKQLEKPRSLAKKWDLHRLEPGPDGRLVYLSRD
jgi:hypothetical protein